jgi:hypothetical protein
MLEIPSAGFRIRGDTNANRIFRSRASGPQIIDSLLLRYYCKDLLIVE